MTSTPFSRTGERRLWGGRMAEPKVVQVKNPKTGKYVKVDKERGIIRSKSSPGPYKGIPIVKR
jgi:hypothetical protein